MYSREIEEQIKALDGKRRGAVAESIRHTVEATDALTRATLLVAYSQLRTAEEIETLGVALHSVLEEGISTLQREISRLNPLRAFDQTSVGLVPPAIESVPPRAIVGRESPLELVDLSQERVSIPK